MSSAIYGLWAELAAIAQAGGDAVDRKVDTALDALISIAGAMAAQQAQPCQIGLEQRDARFLG